MSRSRYHPLSPQSTTNNSNNNLPSAQPHQTNPHYRPVCRKQSLAEVNTHPSSPKSLLTQHPLYANTSLAVENEALKNLMMSWYYAGYYTGYYEGKQHAEQESGGDKTGSTSTVGRD